jgi:hypothetical protein
LLAEFKQHKYLTLSQRFDCVQDSNIVIKDVVELIAEGLPILPDAGIMAEAAD